MLLVLIGSSEAAVAQPVIFLSGGCSPSTIRPNESTLVHCDFEVSNQGDAAVQSAALRIGPAGTPGTIPDYFVMGTGASGGAIGFQIPSVDLGTLAPGATVNARMDIVVKAEASFSALAMLSETLTETVLASLPGELTVSPRAPQPADRSLRVYLLLEDYEALEDETAASPVTILIRNESTEAVHNIGVRHEYRGTATMRWLTEPGGTIRSSDRWRIPDSAMWSIPVLEPGGTFVLSGELAKDGPCLESDHGVIATGTGANGAPVEAGDLGHWYYRYCECGQVDCWPVPPTPAALAMAPPDEGPAAIESSEEGSTPGGISNLAWIAVAVGAIVLVSAPFAIRRLRS